MKRLNIVIPLWIIHHVIHQTYFFAALGFLAGYGLGSFELCFVCVRACVRACVRGVWVQKNYGICVVYIRFYYVAFFYVYVWVIYVGTASD